MGIASSSVPGSQRGRKLSIGTILHGHDLVVDRSALLGSGSFGAVHLAHDKTVSSDVAVKVIPFSKTSIDEDREAFEVEVSALESLADSDHVVGIERSFTINDNKAGVIVMELADGQDLDEYLQEHGDCLDRDTVLWIAVRLAIALRDLHEAGWVHRDVKCGNILLYRDADGHLSNIKLCDFGLVAKAGEPVEQVAGTLQYMSDVLVRGYNGLITPPKPRPADDMFAFACVMLELMGGVEEFDEWHDLRLVRMENDVRKRDRLRFPKRIRTTYRHDLLDLLEQCWHDDWRWRPSANDIVDLLEEINPSGIVTTRRPSTCSRRTRSQPGSTCREPSSASEAGAHTERTCTPGSDRSACSEEAGAPVKAASGASKRSRSSTATPAPGGVVEGPGGIASRVKRRRR
ncbi:Protein kinase domain-containing protein [Plasmodiophora brassicae]|nr:hypothetical protein PBRA_003207 [Plasmodiophora brassicae]